MKKLKAIPRLRSSILIDELASTPLTLLDDLHRVPVGPTNQNALCEAQDAVRRRDDPRRYEGVPALAQESPSASHTRSTGALIVISRVNPAMTLLRISRERLGRQWGCVKDGDEPGQNGISNPQLPFSKQWQADL